MPSRHRLVALNWLDRIDRNSVIATIPMLMALPSRRTASIILLVLGNTALVAGFGYLAIHSFFKLCGL